jgi:feruloyl esterase
VAPSNASEIVKQWADLHGLPIEPSSTGLVDGYPRQVWRSADGQDVIESFSIPAMAHGTPLAVGEDCDQCGAAGAFLLDVGISSSYHIARFWGLADRPAMRTRDATTLVPATAEMTLARLQAPPQPPSSPMASNTATDVASDAAPNVPPGGTPAAAPFDVGAVITNALKAAGLMKSP